MERIYKSWLVVMAVAFLATVWPFQLKPTVFNEETVYFCPVNLDNSNAAVFLYPSPGHEQCDQNGTLYAVQAKRVR